MTDKEIVAYKRRLYREANPEKMKAYVADWQKANPDKCREASRRYYAKHKAKCIARAKAWQAANPDRMLGYIKKWKAANPEKIAAIKRRYYLKRKARIEAALAQYKPSHA